MISDSLTLLEQIHQHMRQLRVFVVFDLDGTLALTEHRVHHLSGARKNWRAFYAACDQDGLSHPIIQTLLALDAAGNEVEIWSGRSDEVQDKTTAWLEAHGLGHIPIRTRKEGDHRADTVVRAEWLDEGRTPDLVFEDRASVVQMWRSRGITCAKVAPGDF